MPPTIEERRQQETLAWYREAYPVVERNCTVAWAAASRMRYQRDKWQMLAAAVTALLMLLAAYNVWSWWLT